MDRRGFIRLSLAGAATGIIAPQAALAASPASMAGGVYYTKDAPGRWSKKVGGHLPQIQVAGGKIEVVTPHEMKGHEHYIIKHMVLDGDFNFLDERMFDPTKDKTPLSQHDLKGYSGRIHVLSVCNKHDTWMNVADV